MSDKAKDPIAALAAIPDEVKPMGEEAAPFVAPIDIDPMKQPLWEIDNLFLNPFAELPEVETWAKMGGRNAIERQGIITFSAKPKQGKSLSIYALLQSILSGNKFNSLTPTSAPRLVIVFDTEMDAPTLQRRAKRMQTALGDNGRRFQIISLLQIPKHQRRAVVDEVTAKYNPDIVVIDQVARMVDDFNASSECVAFGEWLAQYAATRTAMVVIHQNKAADNTQMKGHLGSIMEELAVENYSVKKDNSIFTLTATNARNSCVDDAAPFQFALDADTNIIDPADILKQQRQKEVEDWRNNFVAIFGEAAELCYSDLRARIMKMEVLEHRAAETKIKKATEMGAIAKSGSGRETRYFVTSESSPY